MSKQGSERWSQEVTEGSSSLDLEDGVFTWDDPLCIAKSLKHSAEQSGTLKGTALQSAMSMLTFYINRTGDSLPDGRRAVLNRAKDELRGLFDSDN